MAILEEHEIDEWFEEQKELLSQRLADELDAKKDAEAAKKRFDAAFHKLLDEYEAKYRSTDAAKARHERLARPFRQVAAWWHERQTRRALAKKRRQELRKKAKFEREYNKLFPSEKRKI